jgi:hypothetical protein
MRLIVMVAVVVVNLVVGCSTAVMLEELGLCWMVVVGVQKIALVEVEAEDVVRMQVVGLM